MRHETRAIETLHVDPNNARAHPQRNLDAIAESLRRFGQQKPIVVTEDGLILAGNGTFEAACLIGWDEIQCVVSTLEGAQAMAYALTDNRTSDLSAWDYDNVSGVIEQLQQHDVDLEELGWFGSEIDSLVGGFKEDDSTIDAYDEKAETFLVKVEGVTQEHKERLVDALNDKLKEEDLPYEAKAF